LLKVQNYVTDWRVRRSCAGTGKSVFPSPKQFEIDVEEQEEECDDDEAFVACPLPKIEFKHCGWF
jgi:hypothetical protein